ncbi:MAG: GGDEF domain-containing protein, partial [Clostridia bacterium]|nr:GGDEF domain-containing protein [Clostridia bacterium]
VLEELKDENRRELAETVRREQESRRELGSVRELAYTDPLTGVKSQLAYLEAEKKIDERISNGGLKELGVAVFDVNGLKLINDGRGHDAGDEFIKNAGSMICAHFPNCPVFRVGGDEFVVLLEGEEYKKRKSLIADFELATEKNQRDGEVVIASGLAVFRPGNDNSFRRVFERADARMYDRKGLLKSMQE